jgi:predicted dehydrogenase
MTIKHRVLVIGVGSIGERHLRCIKATGRVALGICEVNDKLRKEVAERYQVEPSFRDFEEALMTPWDAAVIATPAPFHIPMARRLTKAGIHFLVEKPLSTSLDGVAELIHEVKARGIKAAVGYVLRCHPVLAGLKQALDSGRFGRPVEFTAVNGQYFPFYRPAYRQIYYTDHKMGGGAIQDAITHMVNATEWLMGPVDRLACDAAHQFLEGVTVEDTVHMLTRHGKVMGSLCLNQYQAPNEVSLTIVCEKGTVRWEMHNQRWRWMVEPSSEWHDETYPPLERDDLMKLQANAFLDVLEGKAQPVCTLAEGLQTLRVNLAALKMAQAGNVLQKI